MFIVGSGATGVVIYVKLRDSATGFAKTGLLWNTAGALCSYTRPKSAAVAIALAVQTVNGAWTSGGFVEIDAANAPGLYRLDLPDGSSAVGVDYSIITIGFTGVLAESVEVILDPMPDVLPGTVLADAGNSTTTFKTNLASAVNNFYKDAWILFRTGTLAGQVKQCSAYAGATAIATVLTGYTATPGNGDTFVIVNR